MVLVFVYGTLKRGHSNFYLLEHTEYKGEFTTLPEWNMYALGGFPAIVPDGVTAIKGEVYAINDKDLERLDKLEGYPNFYKRKLMLTPYGKAWVYFMQTCHDICPEADLVISGEW